MKKALGGLFTRPYQSPEAHGTAGAPGVFSLARFQFLLLPSQDGVRPRPLLPAHPRSPPPPSAAAATDTGSRNSAPGSSPMPGLATSGLATGSSSVGVFRLGLVISASCPRIKQG